MSPEVLIYSTAVLYGISTLHYLLYLIFRKEKLATVGLYSARFGFLTNFIAIVFLIIQNGSISLFSPKGAFLLFAISVVTVYLYFSTKHKLSLSGAFLMPWATLFVFIASLTSGVPKNTFSVGIVGLIHIVSAFFGYSAFIFGALLSIIYLIFESHLKKKKFSVFFQKLPSLSLLESVIYHAVTVGFFFTTVSMFAGALWSEKIFGTYWSWHPKQVATLISWFVYAGILHLYLYGEWNGKKFCYLNLLGLLVIVINFLGVNLLSGKDIHSFKG